MGADRTPTRPSDGTDVFISYKREERGDVERIAERLRGLGLQVWFDTKLASGVSFDEEINREVRAAKCVLVCWSPGAMASDWVRAEASIGRGRNVLAAVMLRPTELFPPFNLIHAEDLSGWQGEDIHAGWLNTLARIGELTDRPDIVQRARRYVAVGAGAAPVRGRTAISSDAGERKKASNGLMMAAAGLAALAVVGVGGWAYLSGQDRGQEAVMICPKSQIETPEGRTLSVAAKVRLLRYEYALAGRGLNPAQCQAEVQAALEAIEAEAWASAKAAKTPSAISTFLGLFPDSANPPPRFNAEAVALRDLMIVNAGPQTASPSRTTDGFDEIDGSDPRVLRAYLLTEAAEVEKARAREALRKLDDTAWARARSGGTISHMRAYLAAFGADQTPPGAYAKEAEAALQALENIDAGVRRAESRVDALPSGPRPPSVRRPMGAVILRPGAGIDLDASQPASVASGGDVVWQRDARLAVTGLAGGQVHGSQAPSLEDCRARRFNDGEQLVAAMGVGLWMCVITDQKAYAAVSIQSRTAPGQVAVVNYIVWRP